LQESATTTSSQVVKYAVTRWFPTVWQVREPIFIFAPQAWPWTKPSCGTTPVLQANVEVTLHGVTRTLQMPAKLAVDKGRFSVQGQADIRQSDFGITPFSVLGGALAVKDELHIIFDVQGVRVSVGG
jgi:hypothetical protein